MDIANEFDPQKLYDDSRAARAQWIESYKNIAQPYLKAIREQIVDLCKRESHDSVRVPIDEQDFGVQAYILNELRPIFPKIVALEQQTGANESLIFIVIPDAYSRVIHTSNCVADNEKTDAHS